jgi:hypothetical protein
MGFLIKLRNRSDAKFGIFHYPGFRNNDLRRGLRKGINTCTFHLSCILKKNKEKAKKKIILDI